MTDETIYIDEDEVKQEEGSERAWTEEFVVAGEELVGTVKKLVKESTVRHVEIINEKHNIHFKVPLPVGVGGLGILFLLGMSWLAPIALIAALVTDCTIRVVRVESAPAEKSPEDAEPVSA
jgi:hypothetical protein